MEDQPLNASDTDAPIKRSREKSISYPYYSLKECVHFLEIIHNIGGKKEAPLESVLSKLNVKSRHNRRFSYLASSSENFGLIVKTNTGIKPTELGTSILFPITGENERKEKLVIAFNSPKLYNKIIEKYNQTILPNNEILKNVFYNMEIAKNVLDRAVMAFIQSAQYANVLDNNNRLLIPTSDDVGIQPVKESKEPTESNIKEGGVSKTDEHSTTSNQEANYHKFEIMTSTGRKASISLPFNSTKEDIEKIKGVLDVFIPN
jgi:hypothetical protein